MRTGSLERKQTHAQHRTFVTTIEWPTVLLAAVIYGAFGLLTWNYHALPWWLVLPLGGYLVAWHGSLQHEAVHDHPTSWPLVNEILVFPSLWLWLPFRSYREDHRQHHNTDSLTDPLEDPESYYIAAADWARFGAVTKTWLRASNSFAGRLILGPWRAVWRAWVSQGRKLLAGDRAAWLNWSLHAVGCGLVLFWVMGVCKIPFGSYLLFFVYPGISLTLMRSFLEHQARGPRGERTVVIEAEAPFALLFLNNNLHALHHAEPGRPWYQLPARYRTQKAALLSENGGYFYRGYRAVMRHHLFRAKEPVAYPL